MALTAWSVPSAPPMNRVVSLPMGLPMAAVDTTGPPAGYFHLITPERWTPYTNPSVHPTYTVPSDASVGDEKILPPVLYVHPTRGTPATVTDGPL